MLGLLIRLALVGVLDSRGRSSLQPDAPAHRGADIALAASSSTTTPSTHVADALSEAELDSAVAVGDTVLPVVSTRSFVVGGVVRLHAGYPNQEDHRVRSMTHNAIYLASAGTEFPHNRYELVSMLGVEPLCRSNCSSHGTCDEQGVCSCASGWSGKDCSASTGPCGDTNCHGRGVCVQGLCHCDPGYAGGYCQVVQQLCKGNCSGHGFCHHDATTNAPVLRLRARLRRRRLQHRSPPILRVPVQLYRSRPVRGGRLRVRPGLHRRGVRHRQRRLPEQLHRSRRVLAKRPMPL